MASLFWDVRRTDEAKKEASGGVDGNFRTKESRAARDSQYRLDCDCRSAAISLDQTAYKSGVCSNIGNI